MNVRILSIPLVLAGVTSAQSTERISVDSTGLQANDHSSQASLSTDGRWIVFSSAAKNLIAGDGNNTNDVFLRDRVTGTTTLVSTTFSGGIANDHSFRPVVSDDGNVVAFWTAADDIFVGDSNVWFDVIVRDVAAGVSTCVSRDSAGVLANGHSFAPAISADGRFVAFHSVATNLVAVDTNGWSDVFVHDRQTAQTTRVDVGPLGAEGNANSTYASLSADGRYVAYQSLASNFVAVDTNSTWDVFVHDRQTGVTTCASLGLSGAAGAGTSERCALSADGRFVAFDSGAPDLLAGDTNGMPDVFVRDLATGTIVRGNVAASGGQSASFAIAPRLSANGRFVSFYTSASDLVLGDTNNAMDVFVRDLWLGVNSRASVDSQGVQANDNSQWPALSGDGRVVAFESHASNLTPGDTNVKADIFVRDVGCPSAVTYCTAKTNSQGCAPSLSLVGSVSASAASGATLTTANVLGLKNGLYFHGTLAPTATPFHGGWLCVKAPLVRHGVQSSGGTSGACDGTFGEDLNAYIASGADPALVAGVSISLQAWSRDPGDAFGDSLSDAVLALICP
ncbi:MAG: hypothetical protein IT453_09150 [Planctomycetes bacterium]|nr:hypothetical protein [Planctomycetota bacterium]